MLLPTEVHGESNIPPNITLFARSDDLLPKNYITSAMDGEEEGNRRATDEFNSIFERLQCLNRKKVK